jgi:hypothetical protein
MKIIRIMNTFMSAVRLIKQIGRLKGMWFKFVVGVGILVALSFVSIQYMDIDIKDIISYIPLMT